MSHAYDLVVIGSGPAGEKAAVKAAYFNHRVALIEREKVFGGAGIQTGTLPSKTLKETALYLSGVYSKGIFSINRELAGNAGIQDFMYRKNLVTQRGANEVERNLKRHDVMVYHGQAEFVDDHTLSVTSESGVEILYAHHILVATVLIRIIRQPFPLMVCGFMIPTPFSISIVFQSLFVCWVPV